MALQYVSDELRADISIVRAAFKASRGRALRFASKSAVLYVLASNANALKYKSAKEQKEPVRECVLIAVLLVVIVITASHPYSRTHTVTHHFLPLLSFLRTNDYTMIALVTTNGGDIYVYRIGTRIECSKTIYSRVYFVRR